MKTQAVLFINFFAPAKAGQVLQKSYKKGASNLCISDCIGTALKTSPYRQFLDKLTARVPPSFLKLYYGFGWPKMI